MQVLQLQLSPPPPSQLAPIKSRMETFWYRQTQFHPKMAVKRRERFNTVSDVVDVSVKSSSNCPLVAAEINAACSSDSRQLSRINLLSLDDRRCSTGPSVRHLYGQSESQMKPCKLQERSRTQHWNKQDNRSPRHQGFREVQLSTTNDEKN